MFTLAKIAARAPTDEWLDVPVLVLDSCGYLVPVASIDWVETPDGRRVLIARSKEPLTIPADAGVAKKTKRKEVTKHE